MPGTIALRAAAARRRLGLASPAARQLPATPGRPLVIFDVGAADGRSSRALLAAFPGAEVWAFEPEPYRFGALQRNVGKRVRVLNVGLGDHDGPVPSPTGTEVMVRRLDALCGEHGVERIDLLSVHTGRQDQQVVAGAAGLLERRAVGVVEVHAAIDP